MAEPVTEVTIRCPQCGAETPDTMPTDSCVWFVPRLSGALEAEAGRLLRVLLLWDGPLPAEAAVHRLRCAALALGLAAPRGDGDDGLDRVVG